MLSKGVQYYGFLGDPGFSISFYHPYGGGRGFKLTLLTGPHAMFEDSMQIDARDIALPQFAGRFRWEAYQRDTMVAERYVDISPFGGTVVAGSFSSLMEMPSIVKPEFAISYGFYDAGPGWSGLTNQDQAYVYVTPNYSRWMGDMVRQMPELANAPFSTLVLPGSHDAGMCEFTTVRDVLRNSSAAQEIGKWVGVRLPNLATAVVDLAFTQKDSIRRQLDLGIRFLDVRPGFCYKRLVPGLFHQHGFVPGYPYPSIVADVLQWLQEHPTEIVVVRLSFKGFKSPEMQPTEQELAATLTQQQGRLKAQDIVVGGKADLSTPVGELLRQKKRLIFLYGIGSREDARSYDSYSDGPYATTHVQPILQALGGMNKAGQAGCDYTVLQLQGTATSIPGVAVAGATAGSTMSSPLMSTKPGFDHATYPWVLHNVYRNLQHDQLLVLLNDFADNALVDYAMRLWPGRSGV